MAIANIVEIDTSATVQNIKQQIQGLQHDAYHRFENDPVLFIDEFQSLQRRLNSFGKTMDEEELYLIRAMEQMRGVSGVPTTSEDHVRRLQ